MFLIYKPSIQNIAINPIKNYEIKFCCWYTTAHYHHFQIHVITETMSRAQKVKQFVYGLGAMGGGLAILMTCADKYYQGDPTKNPKRALFNKIRSQLRTYYTIYRG